VIIYVLNAAVTIYWITLSCYNTVNVNDCLEALPNKLVLYHS